MQLPHPTGLQKSLGLTGRYIYIEAMSEAGSPFSIHFDFAMAERSHSLRISASNLFKVLNQTSGFVVQVPLDLHPGRWAVACLDVTELLRGLFPAHYSLEGAHTLKSITLCSNVQVRGVYTSDNEYDYVTLPSDMRYKFAFDTATKWHEHFDWFSAPAG